MILSVPPPRRKVSKFLNEVDATEDSNDIRVPFKKFLRDKATYSADEIAFVSDGESFPLLGSGKVNGAALKQLAIEKFSRR